VKKQFPISIGRAQPATPAQMEIIKRGIRRLEKATANEPNMHNKILQMQEWIEGTRGETGDVEALQVLVLSRSDVGAHNLANPYHLYIPNTFEEVGGRPASLGDLRAAIAVFAEWEHDATYPGGRGLNEKEAQVELNALLVEVNRRYPFFVFPFRHIGQ
jgi:hypothetical protein